MFVEKAFVIICFEFFSPVLEGPQTQARSRRDLGEGGLVIFPDCDPNKRCGDSIADLIIVTGRAIDKDETPPSLIIKAARWVHRAG